MSVVRHTENPGGSAIDDAALRRDRVYKTSDMLSERSTQQIVP